MINYLWAFMIVAGALWGGLQGNTVIYEVSTQTISSAKEAVELSLMLLGVVGLWSGVMKIAEKSGLAGKWAKGIGPAISFLFPDVPPDHPVRNDIATNMIANILGLGWAATPAGLKAMKGLKELDRPVGSDFLKQTAINREAVASNSMCTLLVINISSLQLIPINIIAYRTEYLSKNATAIIGPAIVATMASTVTAVLFCKLACRRNKATKAPR